MAEIVIVAPDPLSADLIALELSQRGYSPQRDQQRLQVDTGNSNGSELAGAIEALVPGAQVNVEGAADSESAQPDSQGGHGLVVGPSQDRRDKWDSQLKRIEIQIARDSGRSVAHEGSSFGIEGYSSREEAAAAAESIRRGITMKFNMDCVVAAVPDASVNLLLTQEQDRRALVQQLGYAIDSTCLVQVRLPNPAELTSFRERLAAAGVKVANVDDRLLIGVESQDRAVELLKECEPPAGAVVHTSLSHVDLAQVGELMRKNEEEWRRRERPRRLLGNDDVGFLLWDATMGQFDI